MGRVIIGNTVGTTHKPQNVVEKSDIDEKVAKNESDIASLSAEVEFLKKNGTGSGGISEEQIDNAVAKYLEGSQIGGRHIEYDGTETGLGENVQEAIDNLYESVSDVRDDIGEAEALLSAI